MDGDGWMLIGNNMDKYDTVYVNADITFFVWCDSFGRPYGQGI